jgi:hypothetical protein
MYETFRMLGKEHEADLERDALKWRRAAEVRGSRRDPPRPSEMDRPPKPERFVPARIVAVLARAARAVPLVR